MRLKKGDYYVISLIIFVSILLYIFQNFIMSSSSGLQDSMNNLALTYGYLGSFLISTFGNLTVLFPVPYVIAIFTLGTLGLNPLLLGISGAIGATIGEFSSYALGRGISMTELFKKYGEKMNRINKLIKNQGFLAVFIFAVTPIPDDILLIPLGMIGYPYKKTLLAMFLGKLGLITFIAYAGVFYANGFEWLTFILGSPTESSVFSLIFQLDLVILFCYLTVRIDWIELIEKIEQIIKKKNT
ncbi:MAG: YqaA family protein [Candidatus Ranarchaeia archaeon]